MPLIPAPFAGLSSDYKRLPTTAVGVGNFLASGRWEDLVLGFGVRGPTFDRDLFDAIQLHLQTTTTCL